MKKFTTDLTADVLKNKMIQVLENQDHKDLLLVAFNEGKFIIRSQKDFGSLSTIEKEYYKVKGNITEMENNASINYEVKPNATFRTLLYIIPLMLLPTIIIPLMGSKSNILEGIILYLLIFGIVSFLLVRKERSLKELGMRDFTAFLEEIK